MTSAIGSESVIANGVERRPAVDLSGCGTRSVRVADPETWSVSEAFGHFKPRSRRPARIASRLATFDGWDASCLSPAGSPRSCDRALGKASRRLRYVEPACADRPAPVKPSGVLAAEVL